MIVLGDRQLVWDAIIRDLWCWVIVLAKMVGGQWRDRRLLILIYTQIQANSWLHILVWVAAGLGSVWLRRPELRDHCLL